MIGHFDTDTIVVGAGAVGLACAFAIARTSADVTLVEAETQIGTGISSRNSEVIHAGIYYPPDSIKAKHCVVGRELLYDFLAKHQVPYIKCGKLIVATDDHQLRALQKISDNATASGVSSLPWLDRKDAQSLEPEISCVAALHSPETGVLDSHQYMASLLAEFEACGGVLALDNPIASWRELNSGFVISMADASQSEIHCRRLVLATGLSTIPYAGDAERIDTLVTPYHYAKGDYFSYSGSSPFRRHIYPLPTNGGLGIHATVGLDKGLKFGPDVTWLQAEAPDSIDLSVDPMKREKFADVIRIYWPKVDADRLAADYSGVRPKLTKPGELAADFAVLGYSDHGLHNFVYLRGIESPGLTASLSLGNQVAEMLAE